MRNTVWLSDQKSESCLDKCFLLWKTVYYEKPNADDVQEAAAAYAAAVSQGFCFLSLPCLVYYSEIN